MGRQNNQSRSLIIMSKQQGWDPTKIAGEAGPLNYREDRVENGDYLGTNPTGPPDPADQSMPKSPAPTNAIPKRPMSRGQNNELRVPLK